MMNIGEITDEEFFERFGDYHVRLHYYESIPSVSVEDLFQMFKARMEREAQDATTEEE